MQQPSDKAYLLIESDSPDSAEEFVRNYPNAKNGIVKSWEVRPWMTIVGKNVAHPVQ